MSPHDLPGQQGSFSQTEHAWLIVSVCAASVLILGVAVIGLAIVAKQRRRGLFYGYPAVDSSTAELQIIQRIPGVNKDVPYDTAAAYVQTFPDYSTFDSPPISCGISESLRMYEFNIRQDDFDTPTSLPELPASPLAAGAGCSSYSLDACGRINISVQYTLMDAKLSVSILELSGVNPLLIVLTAFVDHDQQSDQMRTWAEIQHGLRAFDFVIHPDDVSKARVQVNVLVGEDAKFSMDSCLNAEITFDLAELDDELDEPVFYDLPLAFTEMKPQMDDVPDSIPSKCPQLLIGLMYIGDAGKLVVSVVKGINYGVYCAKPDAFVKATLISPYGDEIEKRVSAVKTKSSSPKFDEEFVFQVPEEELDYVHISLTVYCVLGFWERKVPLGSIMLGARTGDKTVDEHWKQMRLDDDEDRFVLEWHRVVDP